MQFIESKDEDPFDIEGIEKPVMHHIAYQELKSYLLNQIKLT